MGPQLFVGLPGLATDILTVNQRLKFRVNLYELKENRRIQPKTLSSLISNMLYEKRFGPYFVEPVIAGLDPKTHEPFICNMDLIGCINEPEDFVVGGTCTDQLYGMCEALWEPDLEPNDLFETISQALINAVDRDAMSGWGAVVHIMLVFHTFFTIYISLLFTYKYLFFSEKDKVTTRHLKTRMD